VVSYEWRGSFGNDEVNALHAEAFGHPPGGDDWVAQLSRHSLGWVCARQPGRLAGFVNVAWNGGEHAFILDTMVSAAARRRGVGTRLVEEATRGARAAGCTWLHVDFEGHLGPFYLASCGFRPTAAGLIALDQPTSQPRSLI
jgi:ribosomal protein S18 acetylase RimI-like enzyme